MLTHIPRCAARRNGVSRVWTWAWAWLAVCCLAPGAVARATDADGLNPSPAGVVVEAGQGETLDGAWSLLFIPYPITEPAVGSGLFAAPVWMRQRYRDGEGRPRSEALGVGVLWTDGGSRGLAAFDRRAWSGGRLWSTSIAADADLALHYDGLAPGGELARGFNLAVTGVSGGLEWRNQGGPALMGLRLFAGQVDLAFDADVPDEVEPSWLASRVNGVAVSYARDSRDDLHSPRRGQHLRATATLYSQWLDASFDAQSLGLRWTRYGEGLGGGVLGVRVIADASFGDPPFYLRPYVAIRGVPALRYAGESVASVEIEQRWPVAGNWDLLAFGGGGYARSDREGASGSASVGAAGLGVRYRARKYFGMTFGLDVAYSASGTATYIQIGNAWSR